MEKAIFGMETLNVTQGMNNSFSHKGTLAIDIAGKDGGIESIKAPFTGVIKRIYKGYVVWLESLNKVKYADGTEDYMTVVLMHDNDTTDLKVGQTIKQGQIFYQEGTTGYATGNHIHLACGKGKYTGNGWYENSYGNWCINNQYDITKALFILESCKIKNTGGYNWVKTSSYTYEKPATNISKLKYNKGDSIVLNGYLYRDSAGNGRGAKKTNYKGKITIVNSKGVKPYHIDSLGWVAESDITNPGNKKYLNLKPEVNSWTVYKTNKYYRANNTSDVLIKLNPQKYNGLSYLIHEDMGNYHFKIKTDMKGFGYISGNPNKYSCTITDTPKYENGNY
ncbi:MAG: M23 family metallopeptidase [Firmicutes bacterium]|nr:M23 family metallopeptidase [Bacillota bacterium]